MMEPTWLTVVAALSLGVAVICFLIILGDILAGHRQQMWIMNVVWPITALWSGPLGLYGYYKVGRLATKQKARRAKSRGKKPPSKQKPFWQSVAVGATHCGSGCSLGDLIAEWFVFFVPITLFGRHIFGTWVLDYGLAFLLGIAFQYFTIKPMRDLSTGAALVEAVKADTLSLTAWQIGMYGWMALVTFVIFGHELPKSSLTFWFMMQIAMILGFCTSYPVNWWLLRQGIKEKM
ncbi:MAG: DUF4396 domain-containing protein [Caldilineaceae bacterium]